MSQPAPHASIDHPPGIPIAVIGMATVLPKAANLRDYWTHILRGSDCIEPVPDSRWRREAYYDPDPAAPDRIYADHGGFVPDLAFDPLLYGIPPTSFASIDSAQLYALAVARQALRDAGYAAGSGTGRTLDSPRSGIVLGVAGTTITLGHDIARRSEIPKWTDALRQAGVAAPVIEAIARTMSACYPSWTEDSFPGSLANIVAGRVANRYGLGAASHTVDAACASSLAAVRLACQELRGGTADLMLSGGVDTDSSPGAYLCFSKTPALSRSGKVRPFDADADGTLISEGVAMLVLKRLDDAISDGDRIYGVIRGLGASTDAAGGAIYAPRSDGQLRALRCAYADAGYAAASVGLIEAHATGTTVGDAIEIESLRQWLADAGSNGSASVALGSVKAQIGHTKAAAGAASLVKALLALHYRVLPGTANVRKPHPLLLGDSPLYLPRQPRPWCQPDGSPRRAGVSAFGFGGANVHLALEEYRVEAASASAIGHHRSLSILLVADDPMALSQRCRELAERARGNTPLTSIWPEHRPATGQPRLGLLADDSGQAIELLERAAQELVHRGAEPEWRIGEQIHYRHEGLPADAKLVAVFSGQGAQTVGMGAQLSIDFPAAREIFETFDAATLARGNPPISRLLYPPDTADPQRVQAQRQALTSTLHAQTAIGAYSMALYRQLLEYGLEPDLALGHSFGELTALWAAGSLDNDQYRVAVLARGAALTPPAGLAESSLLAVNADAARVRALLPQLPGIALANLNSPRQTVVGGGAAALAAALPRLAEVGLHAVRIPVAAAFHTEHVSYAEAAWRAALADLTPVAPRLPVLANLTAERYPDAPAAIREWLARQPFQPVRFQEQIEAAYAAGGRIFLEIGPRGVLTRLVGEILGEQPHVALATAPEPAADDGRQLQWAVLRLAVLGLPMRGDSPPLRELTAPAGPLAMRISAANASTAKRVHWPQVAPVAAALGATPPGDAAPVPPALIGGGEWPIQASLADTHRHFLDGQLALAQSLSQRAPSTDVLAQIERGQQQTMALHLEFLRGQQELLGIIARPATPSSTCAPVGAETASVGMSTANATLDNTSTRTPPATPLSALVSTIHSASPTLEADRIRRLLLSTVAEKTGFPEEMLQPAMRLEADLGVDSIKRVEILAAMREALGLNDHGDHADALRQASTLEQIANLLDRSPAGPASNPPVAPTPTRTAAAAPDCAGLLLRTVAEKTGFPVDMLTPDMRLESDLGIDSIKRVEILAAVSEALGIHGPDETAEERRQAATLAQIAALFEHSFALSSAMPATSNGQALQANGYGEPIPIEPGLIEPGPIDIDAQLLRTVAEKTGFPVEMLDPDMRLEADLGVDSIKRVEILASMRDALGLGDSGEATDALRQAHTMREIGQLLRRHFQTSSSMVSERSKPAAPPQAGIGERLLDIVAEKTGFPREMLDAGMRLEADLGIDSIKRVEILASMRAALGATAAEPDGDELRDAATVAEIASLLARHAGGERECPAASTRWAGLASPMAWQALPVLAIPLPPPLPKALRDDTGPVLLLDDGGPLTDAVAAALSAAGELPLRFSLAGWTSGTTPSAPPLEQLAATLEALAADHGTPQKMLLLQPIGDDRSSRDRLASALFLLQVLLPMNPLAILACGRLDGRLGYDGGGDSIGGGLAGLLKTMAQEHPRIATRFVDLAATLPPAEAAGYLLRELADLDHQHSPGSGPADAIARFPLECGWNAEGRWTLSCGNPLEDAAEILPPLSDTELVLVTGGARGITAACIQALAREVPAHFVLIGRTDPGNRDPSWASGIADDAALKARALEHLRATAGEISPRAVERSCHAIQAAREVSANLAALRALGARVTYLTLDLGDRDATRDALKDLVARHGPIGMLVHGAGALADKRILDKRQGDIKQVFAPKLDALLTLLEGIRMHQPPPRRVLLFSSTAGYAGNAGQADYAMANEALSKLALRLGRDWPGSRVVALNWGPWDGGMVGPALRKSFAKRGVGLLPLAEGAAIFVEAACSRVAGGHQQVIGETELVGAGASIELEHTFSPLSDPLIDEHRIHQRAVLPSAWVAGWLVESAARWRGRVVSSLEDYRVFKGVVFESDQAQRLRLSLEIVDAATVRAKVSDLQGRPRFAGTLRFDRPLQPQRLTLPPEPAEPVADAAAYLAGPIRYGASFRGVERVLKLDRQGALIECRIPAHVPEHGAGHGLGPLTYDIASHACLVWLMAYQAAACLPASMGRLCWRGDAPMPRHFLVEMRLRSLEGTRFGCDFFLADREGHVFATYENFVATVVAADSPSWRLPEHPPLEQAPLEQEPG